MLKEIAMPLYPYIGAMNSDNTMNVLEYKILP